MEMEIDKHSRRYDINQNVGIKTTRNERECKTLGRENNRENEESFLEISNKFPGKAPELDNYPELHYNWYDQYLCSKCNITFPNDSILDIHIEEVHSTFFKILSARQPMYKCYVLGCDLKFSNSVERRKHCISVHKYSKNSRIIEDRTTKTDLKRICEKLKKDPKILLEKPTQSQKRKISEEFEDYKIKTFDSESRSSPQLDKSIFGFIPRQVALQNSDAIVLASSENVTEKLAKMTV